ncbi:TetR/AcrR family transcriptional regulator [Albidovulum aquaemixtae]|nr:TetR/AcrR family transcriptional regulator [Defluviimonas aquaemixtae]
MRAFWANGYEATSVSDLVAATGLNRGSLYGGFGDKRTLFVQALRHYDATEREGFLTRVAATEAPRDAILAAFEQAARDPGPGGTPPGCLLVNTALECAPHDAEIAGIVNAAFCEVEVFFRTRIEAAIADGALGSDIEPRATARALVGLFLGLRVLARSGADQALHEAVIAQARNMVT